MFLFPLTSGSSFLINLVYVLSHNFPIFIHPISIRHDLWCIFMSYCLCNFCSKRQGDEQALTRAETSYQLCLPTIQNCHLELTVTRRAGEKFHAIQASPRHFPLMELLLLQVFFHYKYQSLNSSKPQWLRSSSKLQLRREGPLNQKNLQRD